MTSLNESEPAIASEVVFVGLLEVLLGLLGHVLEDYGGFVHEVLSDQRGQGELYGVVDLFLGSADEDQVQRPRHLRLEWLGGWEVGEEFGEDIEDVPRWHQQGQISGHVDCNLQANVLRKHLEERAGDCIGDVAGHRLHLVNPVPLQVKLLELVRHLNRQLLHVLLQQAVGLLAPDEVEVKIDDQGELKVEHLQDHVDELRPPPEDLRHVFLGSVVLEDLDGEEAADDAVAEVLSILEVEELAYEDEAYF